MFYKEIEAPEDVASHVECLWIFRTGTLGPDAAPHVIVPDGAVSLTFFMSPGGDVLPGLTGPCSRAHQVKLVSNACYGGIRLRPGAAGSVLKADIRRFRDVIGPLTDFRSPAVEIAHAAFPRRFREPDPTAALRAAARAVVEAADPLDAAVCAFAGEIMAAGGDVTLEVLAEKVPLGPRQLRRRFLYQCGLSPKEFARLRRVRQSCIELVQSGSARLAEAAVTAGFCDQPHMTREFRDVFRNSAALVTAYLRQIMHESLVTDR